MKVLFLDGPSLVEKFPKLMESCTKLDIAMAYVKISGLRTLLKNVNKLLKRRVPIRIVFGLSFRHGITDRESAEYLLKLSKRKNVTVKKWNHSGFHPKLLIFHGKHPSIVVGSANLTGAAQSKNAEASIMVEDAEPQLLQKAIDFFEYYFNSAPTLKREDIDAYKHQTYQIKQVFRRKFKEDNLPPPLQRKHELENVRPNKIWKIAPGVDACYWDEWLKAIDDDGEGIVAIGWNEVGNLNKYSSWDSLKRAVAEKAKTVWDRNSDRKTKVKYVTDQLWTFKNEIVAGDVLIVYSETRVLGIAEVTAESKYRYGAVNDISFSHQMNVKYRWYRKWPHRADDKIVKILGKQGTLRLVEDRWLWNYLLKKIS
ncbi:MAG: phospholipase D-like domain-containing protein [Candidatus Baldrarchaeia archaeon]